MKDFFYFFTSGIYHYIFNYWITFIPSRHIRVWYLRLFSKIGKNTWIDMRTRIIGKVIIGDDCHINSDTFLKNSELIIIGNNVSISYGVKIITDGHDIQSSDFKHVKAPIIIDDYVWIGIDAKVLKGVHVGRGAVICAGAIVIQDVEPYMIVAGIPAKPIGERTNDLQYTIFGNLKGYKKIRFM